MGSGGSERREGERTLPRRDPKKNNSGGKIAEKNKRIKEAKKKKQHTERDADRCENILRHLLYTERGEGVKAKLGERKHALCLTSPSHNR